MFNKAKLEDAEHTARAQIGVERYIPLAVHVAPDIIRLRENGDYCATWRLHGIPFETAAPEIIGAAKNQLVNFLHALRGSDRGEPAALWVHRVRRLASEDLGGVFPSAFATTLDQRYRERLAGKRMLRTEIYFTFILRPTEGLAKMVKRERTASGDSLKNFDGSALERFESMARQIDASMKRYGGQRLTSDVRKTKTGTEIHVSQMLTFYRYLLTGHWEDVPIQAGSIYNYLCDARLFAGNTNGIVQTSLMGENRFCGYLGLLDYPEFTEPGLNNCLFSGDYPFIESQSFSYLSKQEGVDALSQQRKRFISSGEASEAQIADMDGAIEDLRYGRAFMGEYHYSLGIWGDTIKGVQDDMARARGALQEEAGYKVALEDLTPECAHFAQLPGNWRWRSRQAKITSRNFASLSPFHNFDQGKRDGNPWGPAIALLRTESGQPYFFNFHESPKGENSQGKKLSGNTFICGMTGAGKSVLMGFLLAMATKIPNLRILFFDKDQGGEVLIRALGGRYRQLKRGQPTGFNPFQWEPTESNIKFTERLVLQCALRGPDDQLDARTENELESAVRRVFALPDRAHRRISVLMQFIGEHTDLGQRLSKWCRTGTKEGTNAWVLDNAQDTTDFSGHSIFGFDYTEFIDDTEVGPIILSYILEAAETMLNGDPYIYVMEEFAKMVAAKSQTLVEFSRDKQTTIRKLNGLGIFVTQSPSQVNNYPIGSTLREQSVTQIFLPNPLADYADYVEGFKLTPEEFQTIKSFSLDSRKFLVRQGEHSSVVTLDLAGMDDELEVISGTLSNINLFNELRRELQTEDPALWLPVFLQRLRDQRKARK